MGSAQLLLEYDTEGAKGSISSTTGLYCVPVLKSLLLWIWFTWRHVHPNATCTHGWAQTVSERASENTPTADNQENVGVYASLREVQIETPEVQPGAAGVFLLLRCHVHPKNASSSIYCHCCHFWVVLQLKTDPIIFVCLINIMSLMSCPASLASLRLPGLARLLLPLCLQLHLTGLKNTRPPSPHQTFQLKTRLLRSLFVQTINSVVLSPVLPSSLGLCLFLCLPFNKVLWSGISLWVLHLRWAMTFKI